MKESDWSEDKEQKGKGGQRGVCGSYNRGGFGRWRSAVKSLEKRARAHFLLLLTPTPPSLRLPARSTNSLRLLTRASSPDTAREGWGAGPICYSQNKSLRPSRGEGDLMSKRGAKSKVSWTSLKQKQSRIPDLRTSCYEDNLFSFNQLVIHLSWAHLTHTTALNRSTSQWLIHAHLPAPRLNMCSLFHLES